MYTQCSFCQTIFAITPAQLAERQGLVRCGKCRAVFHAEQCLFDTLPEDVERAPRKESARKRPPVSANDDDEYIPTITDFTSAPRRRHTGLWVAGSVFLSLALVAQLAFHFRDYLAADERLRPWVTQACARLACEIRPLRDPNQIELLEVEVAPHNQYNRALTLNAVMVNRARFAQPLPLLELTLTDSRGAAVARRTFHPHEYLVERSLLSEDMTPDVVVNARLEFTQPGTNAVGYEVQLVSPS